MFSLSSKKIQGRNLDSLVSCLILCDTAKQLGACTSQCSYFKRAYYQSSVLRLLLMCCFWELHTQAHRNQSLIFLKSFVILSFTPNLASLYNDIFSVWCEGQGSFLFYRDDQLPNTLLSRPSLAVCLSGGVPLLWIRRWSCLYLCWFKGTCTVSGRDSSRRR